MSAAEHGFEIANGRWTAAISVGALPDQIHGSDAEAVVSHNDRSTLGGDDAAGGLNASGLSGVTSGEIENQDVTIASGYQLLNSGFGGLQEDLKISSQGGGKNRLQRAIFGI
jgi:hypothetical protein